MAIPVDVAIATLTASIAEVRDNMGQASLVVTNLRADFDAIVAKLEKAVTAKIESQRQNMGADAQVLKNEVASIRGQVGNFMQSYDKTSPAKIVELYEQAKDQHIRTTEVQQATEAIYIQMQGLSAGCQSMHGDMTAIKAEVTRLQAEASMAVRDIRGSGVGTDLALGAERLRVDQVIKDLNKLEAVVRRYDTEETRKEVDRAEEVLGKMASLEGKWQGKGGGGKDGGEDGRRQKGYLPFKDLMPSKLGKEVAGWRRWKEDILDFLDTQQPGMRGFLKDMVGVEGRPDPGAEFLRDKEAEYGQKVTDDDFPVHRALVF
jgi:hypothetical protein